MSFAPGGHRRKTLRMNTGRKLMCVIRGALLLGAAFVVAISAKAAELDLAELFAKTSPSVVKLTTYSSSGGKLGQGSGFIVDKSGVIVTCLHVIAGAATVEIQSADESTHTATAIIRIDKDWDVALLKIAPLPEPALKLAPPDAVRIGAAVAAIGSPLGYGNTLSQGIISGLRPHAGKSDMIQITAPISPGSSGGPILSTSTGEILGMTASSVNNGQNINFAVPARVISEQLKTIGDPPEQKLEDFTDEVKKTMAESKKIRTSLEQECTEKDATTINRTIEQAIESGVGIYNEGNALGCFRVYEGAAYKILFSLSERSGTASSVLKKALHKADSMDNSASGASAKAWVMRNAFDSISGIHGKRP
jgi:hypothetical protein